MSDLIAQYQQLHKQKPKYGGSGSKHIPAIVELADKTDSRTILDYGCGKGNLVRKLREQGYTVEGYDPGVAEWATKPAVPYDLVISTDVLEHIPPQDVKQTVTEIIRYANQALYLAIALRYDSTNILPDGTNPHKTVWDVGVWHSLISGLLGDGWHCYIAAHKPNYEGVICATRK
jgi:hypothetical protein